MGYAAHPRADGHEGAEVLAWRNGVETAADPTILGEAAVAELMDVEARCPSTRARAASRRRGPLTLPSLTEKCVVDSFGARIN